MPWLLLAPVPAVTVSAGQHGPAELKPLSLDQASSGVSAPLQGGVVELEAIDVVARRGAAAMAPEIEFDATAIDDFGGYDIGEVVGRASTALGLGSAPVLIVNGRRVANPRDILNFPPDALVRLEVLPAEASSLYGGDASRRVLNLVLQQRFQSREGLVNASRPSAGGRSTIQADVRRSTIDGNDTGQFGLRASRETSLRADERSIDSDGRDRAPGVTLRPESLGVGVNLSTNRALGAWSASLGLSGRRQSDQGVAETGGAPIPTRNSLDTASLVAGLSGELTGWRVQSAITLSATEARQTGLADQRSQNQSVAATLNADRRLFDLPAGPVLTALSARIQRSWAETHGGLSGRTSISAQTSDLRANLSLPLSNLSGDMKTSLRPRWGTTTLTVGGALRQAEDAGGGRGADLVISWSPDPKLRVSASWASTSDNPLPQQRFDPAYYGLPRLVFDFSKGQAVEVRPLLGGNPDLKPQMSTQTSLSTSAGPFTRHAVFGTLALRSSRITDGAGPLPVLTPAVEAAFPERFMRDPDGRLVGVDQRSINLREAAADTLSSNVTFRLPVGDHGAWRRPPSLLVSVNHSWQLRSTTILRTGMPLMDRLAGDGGGLPRHELTIQVDGRWAGWGLNAGARRQAGYRIRRDSGRDSSDDLRLSSLRTVDLKISYLVERALTPATAGSSESASRRTPGLRWTLEVENLFDARPEATLGNGRPAPGYGRDDQDPFGRVLKLTLSRRF